MAKSKKNTKTVTSGMAHIHSTHNNTIVTFTDMQGSVIAWSSAGAIGYKGSKKSTPYAAQLAAKAATESAKEHGLREVNVQIKGIGPGKDAATKQLEVSGLKVNSIIDITPVAYNGTRPPKRVLKRAEKR